MKDEKKELAKFTGIVMPAVTGTQALEAWKQYVELKEKIVDPQHDVQKIAGKDFLKKSYWRKVATFFNLSVEVVDESHETIGRTVVWHFTCKAVAPNGRFAVGVGSCDAFEKAKLVDGRYVTERVTKWKTLANGKHVPDVVELMDAEPNSLHNIRSTAETRAFNRAVSNLVGGGEVSAEEVDAKAVETEAKKEESK